MAADGEKRQQAVNQIQGSTVEGRPRRIRLRWRRGEAEEAYLVSGLEGRRQLYRVVNPRWRRRLPSRDSRTWMWAGSRQIKAAASSECRAKP